jgi:hypothetical protein
VDPVPAATTETAMKTRRRRRRELKQAIELAVAPAARVRASRCEVQRVRVWSVLRVALCFYLAALAVTLVALVVLWAVADAAGVIGNVERFMGDLLSASNYRLLPAQLFQGVLLVGLVLVALMTLLSVIAAALYNLFADWVGGVECTLVEAERR